MLDYQSCSHGGEHEGKKRELKEAGYVSSVKVTQIINRIDLSHAETRIIPKMMRKLCKNSEQYGAVCIDISVQSEVYAYGRWLGINKHLQVDRIVAEGTVIKIEFERGTIEKIESTGDELELENVTESPDSTTLTGDDNGS